MWTSNYKAFLLLRTRSFTRNVSAECSRGLYQGSDKADCTFFIMSIATKPLSFSVDYGCQNLRALENIITLKYWGWKKRGTFPLFGHTPFQCVRDYILLFMCLRCVHKALTASACCLIFSVSILVAVCSMARRVFCWLTSVSFSLWSSPLNSLFCA